MWSNVASTKETETGLKKFYKFPMEIGLVDEADYKFLLSEIKLNMDEWLAHYDDEHGR